MQKWLGGSGVGAVRRAALFGAPLPLCSCGVLPAAIGLRRAGASRETTVSFLISTPETSVYSVAVTYALMGPVMAIYRPLAALSSAVFTGIMVSFVKEDTERKVDELPLAASCCAGDSSSESVAKDEETDSYCSTESSCCDNVLPQSTNRFEAGCLFCRGGITG